MREIIRRLRSEPPSDALASEALTALRERFDPELLDQIEQTFGCTVSELYRRIAGTNESDPTAAWSTTCSWLGAYLQVTAATESPRVFHLFSALSVASAAFGASCFIDLGYSKVYPPIPVILLGPSGVRKSSAIALATQLLEPLIEAGQLTAIRDRFTVEGLVDTVRSNSKVILLSSELSATLGKAKYLEGLIPVLTRLLDQEGFESTTRTYGITRVTDVAFGFLGASTVDWLLEEVPNTALSGGFLGRFLLAYSKDATRVVYRTNPLGEDITRLGKELLRLVEKTRGKVLLSADADHYLQRWYEAFRTASTEEYTIAAPYYSRKLIHIVRIAMVLTLLDGRRVIAEDSIRESIQLLDAIEPKLVSVLAELSGNVVFRDLAQAIRIIRKRPFPMALLAQALIPSMGRKRYQDMLLTGTEMGILVPNSKTKLITVDFGKVTPLLRRVLSHELEELQTTEGEAHPEAPQG